MPAINFRKRFAEMVESGIKQQTIRRERKHPIKVGDLLYLYTGMRTKYCRKIGEAVCKSMESITIDREGIKLGKCYLTGQQQHDVAWADGFRHLYEFVDWFNKLYGLPFKGVLIEW